MPFETPVATGRRIAVIGAGIAGMTAAYHLSAGHAVTLIEAQPRLGGHARTVVAGRRGDQPVDTGFIVYNHQNYPNLSRLFAQLGVPTEPSCMSFAASVRGGTIEYGLQGLRQIFAQPRNLARPAFVRMMRDLLHFNANAVQTVGPDLSIGDLLERLGTGSWFRDYYLYPMSGAIWSTPATRIADFPAQALVDFFRNHALLGRAGKPEWRTVTGGSTHYVARLRAAMSFRGVAIRTGQPVEAVRRDALGAEVRTAGAWERFDDVVFATHSDEALTLLTDADAGERSALAAVRYQDNRAVLHADPAVMPRRRGIWASWNYREEPGPGPVSLTYWMNKLQNLPADDPLFVTLNARTAPDPARVYDEVTFRHPLFDGPAFAAQAALRARNGARATWFCGAWMRHGFHEDGYVSALDVARGIEARATAARAA